MEIRLARIYEEVKEGEFRLLCDRLWPRAVKKQDARIDLWPKEITPTSLLRKDYHQGKISYETFKERYLEELHANPETPELKNTLKGKKKVALLTSSKEIEESHLPILKKVLFL